MNQYVLSIDQGTTSTRAIIFDTQGQALASAQQEFTQYFPHNGWVEHDPEQIWESTIAVCRLAIERANIQAKDVLGIGISNQRETTLVWERATGKPIYPAIVWQDRRTAERCSKLVQAGKTQLIQNKTGLLIDPYFSGTKVEWILSEVPEARIKAEAGELAFGTVDTFLLWRLTGGKAHKTDATNAARTLMYNICDQQWDPWLLAMFHVPESMMPEVEDCTADFGVTDPQLFGAEIPILGMAGDQQAAMVGQACFRKGMSKITYGTGCFLMLNTGSKPVLSQNKLLTTIAYRIKGQTAYAMEGSIFMAGAAVQWLRDQAKMIQNADQTQAMASAVPMDHGVYMVPAFTGLGAPHWDPNARGALLGLTRDSGINEIVSACLQSVAYQTLDLINAMGADGAQTDTTIRVDGGMVRNDWFVSFLSDILNLPVDRPAVVETSALGASYLVCLQADVYDTLGDISSLWQCDRSFSPDNIAPDLRTKLYAGWQQAVSRVRTHK